MKALSVSQMAYLAGFAQNLILFQKINRGTFFFQICWKILSIKIERIENSIFLKKYSRFAFKKKYDLIQI